MSSIKVQLKNQKTVSIPIEQFLSMSDIEWEDLMNSDYGYIVDNPFASDNFDTTEKIDKYKDLDISPEDLLES